MKLSLVNQGYSGKYGNEFNNCLGEVFGKDSPGSQTLANAPELNTAESSATLKRRTGAETNGTVVGTIIAPKDGKGGGIRISEGAANFYGTNDANTTEVLLPMLMNLLCSLIFASIRKEKMESLPVRSTVSRAQSIRIQVSGPTPTPDKLWKTALSAS